MNAIATRADDSLLRHLEPLARGARIVRDSQDRLLLEIPVDGRRILVQVLRRADHLEATALLGWPLPEMREAAERRKPSLQVIESEGSAFVRARVEGARDIEQLARDAAQIIRTADFTPVICDVFAHFQD